MWRDETGPADASAPAFDVRRYARTAQGSHRGALDLEAYRERPLDAPILDELAHLERVERATMHHLRTVLVAPTHKDARVTGFLVTWAYERHWLADALRAVVDVHEAGHGLPAAGAVNDARVGNGLRSRFAPLGHALVTNLLGPDVIAVHTAIGTVDDWAALEVYEALDEDAAHPELSRTLTRIRAVRSRHSEFFAGETRRRLAESRRARRLVRWQLLRQDWPIVSNETAAEDTARFYRRLVADGRGRAVDERIGGLPGLEELRPLAAAARRARAAALAARRPAPTPIPSREDRGA